MLPDTAVSLGLRVHHIGIACRDLEATRDYVTATHAIESTAVAYDELQDADLCLLTDADGFQVELVAGPAVASFVKRNQTYYHVCYEVGDLDATVLELIDLGCRTIKAPCPARLFGGRRVCFLFSPMGIIELLEAS